MSDHRSRTDFPILLGCAGLAAVGFGFWQQSGGAGVFMFFLFLATFGTADDAIARMKP